ncbi:MAG: HD domain-containing protein [Candidatus Aminicenantes bacterium]|nr:MAG: HD domain-containing protein [Candidatus Aminicenantes bacterium]
MKEKIERLFNQQLSKIKDPDLRAKVIEIWTDAANQGGWQPDELEKIPFTLLTETKGINLIEHTIAVTEGALGLATAIKENYREMPFEINFDWLIAGGLLHDVGKLMEIEKTEEGKFQKSYQGKCTRHPISGAILVAQAGVPEEIVNIVACHAKEGEGRPKRVETVLIHQADFSTFDPMVMMEKGLLIV